ATLNGERSSPFDKRTIRFSTGNGMITRPATQRGGCVTEARPRARNFLPHSGVMGEMDLSAANTALASMARRRMHDLWLADEAQCVDALLPLATLNEHARARVRTRADNLVTAVRAARSNASGV